MYSSPQPFPIHRQSFEEILPTLTQCLHEQALSHHRRLGHAASLSIRSTKQSVLHRDSRPASISPDSPQSQSPQFCGPNSRPIQSQTLTSPGSHLSRLSLTPTSCSPSPRVLTDNVGSGAQETPESHFSAVPIEIEHRVIPDVPGAGLPTPTENSAVPIEHRVTPDVPGAGLPTPTGNSAVPIEHRVIPDVPGAGLPAPTENSTVNHPQSTVSKYSARRIEHKIRGLDRIMHWYDSRGCEPLLAPPPCESLECGDLYIHQSLSTPTSRQMWIWSAQQGWQDAQECQAHPLLPMHRLWFSATGEPRWVTQKTISTYKGRFKVSGKLKLDQSRQSLNLFFFS
jgi:hypothetical protein